MVKSMDLIAKSLVLRLRCSPRATASSSTLHPRSRSWGPGRVLDLEACLEYEASVGGSQPFRGTTRAPRAGLASLWDVFGSGARAEMSLGAGA